MSRFRVDLRSDTVTEPSNQMRLRLHFKGPGHLVAAAAGLHVTSVEVMTAAALAGIAYRTVDAGPRGWIDAEHAARLLEPDEFYDVEVIDLLAVENTVGAAGGRVMPLEELRAVRKVANDAGVPVHLDGARILNAAVAEGVDAAEIAAESDTVMFCLSKGLGAPIGSVLWRLAAGRDRGGRRADRA